MPSNPTLPLETIQTIINILAEDDDDHTSLKVCSLTCQTLLHLCRKHIFRSITLDGRNLSNAKPTTARLINLISTTPEIADCIQQLDFYISSDEFTQPLLPGILTTITKLNTLIIRWPRYQRKWKNNPLRAAILHLLHLPTLINLELQDIVGFTFADLTPSVGLKGLRFSHIEVGESENQHPSSEKPIQLQRLSIGIDSSTAIAKLSTGRRPDGTSIFDFSTLTSVSLELRKRDELEAWQNLLKLCGHLHNVTIYLNSPPLSCTGLATTLNPSMESLNHLHVQIVVEHESETEDPLSGLTFELDKMRSHQNHIRTIIIGVTIQTDYECHRGDQWGLLDRALTQTGWPMLEYVSLNIKICSFQRESDSGLEVALRALKELQFPRLSSNKSVGFNFSVVEEWV